MTTVDLFAPEDDAFIRTAIRGLRPPDHHPTFWDVLRDQLDDVADALAAEGLLPVPAVEPLVGDLPLPEPEVEPEPEPEPEPEAQVEVEPEPEPLLAEAPRPVPGPQPRHAVTSWGPEQAHPPRRAPLRAGPAAGRTPRAFVPAPEAPVERAHRQVRPRPARIVHHDRAVLPDSLRRTSNVVLLAVAVAAAIIALVAGLTLVRQRSDGGSAPPVEAPQPGDAAGAEGPG